MLLLNAGKGNEFKGKCLNEIEVGQDIIEFDDQDEEKIKTQQYEINTPSTDEIFQDEFTLPSVDDTHVSNSTAKSRVRWSDAQKKLVFKFFKGNIDKKIPPRKIDCINFIRLNNNVFKESEWLRIKTLVYNTYRLQ